MSYGNPIAIAIADVLGIGHLGLLSVELRTEIDSAPTVTMTVILTPSQADAIAERMNGAAKRDVAA